MFVVVMVVMIEDSVEAVIVMSAIMMMMMILVDGMEKKVCQKEKRIQPFPNEQWAIFRWAEWLPWRFF